MELNKNFGYTGIYPDVIKELSNCVYAIECSSETRHQLWCRYAIRSKSSLEIEANKERIYQWESDSQGYGYEVGKILNMPIWISLAFATIDGHRVVFYYSDSQLVYWPGIEQFMKDHFILPKNLPKESRSPMCDSANIHSMFGFIKDLNKEK